MIGSMSMYINFDDRFFINAVEISIAIFGEGFVSYCNRKDRVGKSGVGSEMEKIICAAVRIERLIKCILGNKQQFPGTNAVNIVSDLHAEPARNEVQKHMVIYTASVVPIAASLSHLTEHDSVYRFIHIEIHKIHSLSFYIKPSIT